MGWLVQAGNLLVALAVLLTVCWFMFIIVWLGSRSCRKLVTVEHVTSYSARFVVALAITLGLSLSLLASLVITDTRKYNDMWKPTPMSNFPCAEWCGNATVSPNGNTE